MKTTGCACGCEKPAYSAVRTKEETSIKASPLNTLVLFPQRCTSCGRCREVCPHGVFGEAEGPVLLARPQACMECGACRNNCPAGAIAVDSGVGCAAAMIIGALRGTEPSCDVSGCCGC